MKKRIFVILAALVILCVACAVACAEECTHSNTKTIAGYKATCTEAGKTSGIECADCGKMLQKPETISPKGHNKDVAISGHAATCTESGLTSGAKCSVCGTTVKAQEVIEALGHSKETMTGYAATCTATGLTDGSKCTTCGKIFAKQETIPAKGHSEETVAGYAADCTAAGLSDGKKCTVCGTVTVEQKTIAALGHDNETIAEEPATCTETGLTAGTKCKRCGFATVRDIIPAKGHDYVSKKVAPTTTAYGYTKHTCSACGDTYKDNYKSKKVAATAAPVATAAPAEEVFSIVTDAEFAAELYTEEKGTKVAENDLLTIAAAADENGAYTLRNLHLSLELIAELKAEGIEYICFVVGEYELVFPIAMFETEEIALIAADLPAELTGYVVTVDPAAVNANGDAGCAVQAALATEDGEFTIINGFLTGMVLCKAEQQVEVVEETVYTFAA